MSFMCGIELDNKQFCLSFFLFQKKKNTKKSKTNVTVMLSTHSFFLRNWFIHSPKSIQTYKWIMQHQWLWIWQKWPKHHTKWTGHDSTVLYKTINERTYYTLCKSKHHLIAIHLHWNDAGWLPNILHSMK